MSWSIKQVHVLKWRNFLKLTIYGFIPNSTSIILDGAVVVQLLHPRNTVTFEEYCSNIFVPYILKWLTSNNRVDIVWDTYRTDSLKICSVARERNRHATLSYSQYQNTWELAVILKSWPEQAGALLWNSSLLEELGIAWSKSCYDIWKEF